jgi:hypothetical protein
MKSVFWLMVVSGALSFQAFAKGNYVYFLCKNVSNTCVYTCPFDQSIYAGTAVCSLKTGNCSNPTPHLSPSPYSRIANTKVGFWADFQDNTQNMFCQWRSNLVYPYNDPGTANETIRNQYCQLFGCK